MEQRCRVGLVCWFDRGRLHTEVLRHRLPARVEFAEFYSRPRPAGDLVVGLGCGRRGWLWCDLAQLPHLLVGGMSGGGKSVFLRQLVTWLVLSHQPSSLRLVLLDFKSGVELRRFGELPHALHEAVTETEDAEFTLRQVVAEIDRRMGALAAARVVDLDAWDASGNRPMARWVVVCDELARLTVGNAGESREERGARERTTALLCDIARMGRAAGVHLVVCTQRPDADAVPGQLKANLAGTVAFRVRNEANSRILLDCDRAALLPSHPGRAIWQDHQLEEFQAIHVSSEECLQRIGERWLREVNAFEDQGGIMRWSPSRLSAPSPRRVTLVAGAVRKGVEASRAGVGALRQTMTTALRSWGAGAGAPAADQRDGAGCRGANVAPAARPRPLARAVSPSAIVLNGRDTSRVTAGPEANVATGRRSAVEGHGGPRVAQGRQNTEECPFPPESVA